jgi:hypothetical protein
MPQELKPKAKMKHINHPYFDYEPDRSGPQPVYPPGGMVEPAGRHVVVKDTAPKIEPESSPTSYQIVRDARKEN